MDRLGLRENTIIVFWSDHGYHVGEHGLWLKTTLFEEAARVPLIIATPQMKTAGQSSPRTVELLDLYPTLADLAGLTPPAKLAGATLRPLLNQPRAEWTRAAYTQLQKAEGHGHSVRTERWRYTEWGAGEKGAQLYDHDKDPNEYVNLTNDPAYANVIAEMKALVRKNFVTQAAIDGAKNPPRKRKPGG
jgi:iduronate 2-sulfatase